MAVNEQLLHNWFYGNAYVREAAVVIFALALGTIPVAGVADWLVVGTGSGTVRAVRMAVPLLTALKGFVPTVIAAHGGGLTIGLTAAAAVMLGHWFSPCPVRRRAGNAAFHAGIVLALVPVAALDAFGARGLH